MSGPLTMISVRLSSSISGRSGPRASRYRASSFNGTPTLTAGTPSWVRMGAALPGAIVGAAWQDPNASNQLDTRSFPGSGAGRGYDRSGGYHDQPRQRPGKRVRTGGGLVRRGQLLRLGRGAGHGAVRPGRDG